MAKTSPARPLRPATQLVRGGLMRSSFDETAEALFLTSGFVYESAEQAEATFLGTAQHYQYSRFGNPTVTMLEDRLALLEGAEACRLTATGMAAVHASMLAHLKTGDRVVASRALFGSCHWIVSTLLPRYGIRADFVDGGDLDQWKRALATPANLVLLETPSNPMLEMVDLAAVSDLAHAAGAIVVVDNVFATPLLQKPLQFGADVVVYSLTKHMDGQGRTLGGSSSINGMIYSRGHRLDYEDWNALGGPGWGWEEMKAAYCAIEDHQLGATDYRGAGGPLRVSAGTFRYPIAEAMIQAGEQLGLPRRDELNHPDLVGVGYYSHTIRRGRRESAATAFLRPIRQRANLVVRTGVLADRVLFDGRRAIGVACRVDGQDVVFRTCGDVIVAGGAIMSPKLLQLSGIGPGELLQSLGVTVVHDSPLVGTGLQEHVAFSMPHRLLGAAGLNRRYRGIGLVPGFVQYYACLLYTSDAADE